MGWNFNNSYLTLPTHLYSAGQPEGVTRPQLVLRNNALAQKLGLSFEGQSADDLAPLFSGATLPHGAEPIAQAYAGHQFGNFTMLGDGRAHLLGEHLTPTGARLDVQLKGSGRTPFSRRGDGKAALGPMLREYIISEAMHALNIPTTRSLAVVTTGEPVFRETVLDGAILTRIAASHIRVGTFQYVAAQRDLTTLKHFADYTINRHDPDLKESETPYLDFLHRVMQRQIDLVVNWMRVGFIHGVMNTDNVLISGETIDYGPCAFMDAYDPKTVFSSIDRTGRYSFGNQAPITQWNLARLAETLIPLLDEDLDKALKKAEDCIFSFQDHFQPAWLNMMRQKLGLFGQEDGDQDLVDRFLRWMQDNKQDYTNTFNSLSNPQQPTTGAFQTPEFSAWWQEWQTRQAQHRPNPTASFDVMGKANPRVIPRNHMVEAALKQAEEHGDISVTTELITALSQPYQDSPRPVDLTQPDPHGGYYQTFCGT